MINYKNAALIIGFILCLPLIFTDQTYAQSGPDELNTFIPEDNIERNLQFMYLNKPVRKEMFEELNRKEKDVIPRHFNYLKMLREKGILILAGPNLDNTFGVVIFFASSEDEAKNIMNNDPAIREEIMTAELHPFRVSLMYDFEKYGAKN